MHFAVVIVYYSGNFPTCQRFSWIFLTFGDLHKFSGVFMCDLYRKIELLCKQNNIKIAELARAIGQNKSMFTDLKTGRKKSFNIEVLISISDYFDISLDELVGRKRKTPDAETSEVVEKIIGLFNIMSEEQKALYLSLAEQLILQGSKE